MQKREKNVSVISIYEKLKEQILSLKMPPGERLIEDEIADELNVSRTPVREALILLQGEGFLERKDGWRMREIKASDLISIFECRLAIESHSTRLTAERATAEDISKMEQIVCHMSELLKAGNVSRSDTVRENRCFHESIVRISRNKTMHEMYEKTMFPYWNIRTPFLFHGRDPNQDYVVEHQTILQSIIEHDPDKAEQLARDHVELTFCIIRKALL